MKYIKLSDLHTSGKPISINKDDVLFCRANLNHLPRNIVYGNPSDHKSVVRVFKKKK